MTAEKEQEIPSPGPNPLEVQDTGVPRRCDDPVGQSPWNTWETRACNSQGRWKHTTSSRPGRGQLRDAGITLPASSQKRESLGGQDESLRVRQLQVMRVML